MSTTLAETAFHDLSIEQMMTENKASFLRDENGLVRLRNVIKKGFLNKQTAFPLPQKIEEPKEESAFAQDRKILFSDEKNDLTCILTKDRNLLEQYYQIRNEIFHQDRGWVKKDWLESEFDRNGNIIIALNNAGEVIGGARLMLSNQCEFMSGEIPNTEYNYKNLLKRVGLDEKRGYGEIDGLIVCKKRRDRHVTEAILKSCIETALKNDCSVLIGIAYITYCKIYKRAYKAVGYGNVTILEDFVWTELEEYNFSKDFPIVNILK